MLIAMHVLVAFASIILTALALILPSKLKLQISCLLVGLTIISGTVITILYSTHLIRTCLTGLVYLTVLSGGLLMVRSKLNRHISNQSE